MFSHNHAPYRSDESGRYVVHKRLGFGCRGPAGALYVVEDTAGEHKPYRAETMAYVRCYILKRRSGLECSPWFGDAARDGSHKDHNLKLKRLEDWYEILE